MSVAIVLLLALAIALFVAEAHVPSGILGLAGIASFVVAGILYRDEGHGVPVVAIVVIALLLGGFVLFAARKVMAAYRSEPVRTGYEELTGATAEVRSPLDPEGQVFVQGTLWRARLVNGGGAVPVGGRVRIESVDGLTLLVRPETAIEEGAR